MLAGASMVMRRRAPKTRILCAASAHFWLEKGARGVRRLPASVYRTWILDKESIKLIVLEAGSLEWRKQVLGADYPVLK